MGTLGQPPNNILVIRRDNIGDLVCTTPAIAALREKFPKAHIAALVNSYNAAILDNNPDLNAVHVYTKAKHRSGKQSKLRIWINTIKLIMRLRRVDWDIVIVATTAYSKSALKFAHAVKPKHIIAFGADDSAITNPIDPKLTTGIHETEAVFRLLVPLGINQSPGPLRLYFNKTPQRGRPSPTPVVGLHISARKPNQRWLADNFAQLAHKIYATEKTHFLVFWAPGPTDHPQHPGDDEKASQLHSLCRDLPLTLYPTRTLGELIEGLSQCNRVICSDGGGMHIAAGLGKPIVCLFGNSDAVRWHPWGVPHTLIQKESMIVSDINIDEVFEADQALIKTAKETSQTLSSINPN